MKDLILCWTSWPSLPEGRLKVQIDESGPFLVSTCFNSITVPQDFSRDQFLRYLRMAMSMGGGFGSV